VVRDLPKEGREPLDLPFLGLSIDGETWVLTTRPLPNVATVTSIEYWYWADAKLPLGSWWYQGGLFSLVESTVAAGQQSCIPCDWYGHLPLVYFFPDLAWSTLRAYCVNSRFTSRPRSW